MVPVASCQCVVFPSDRFDCIFQPQQLNRTRCTWIRNHLYKWYFVAQLAAALASLLSGYTRPNNSMLIGRGRDLGYNRATRYLLLYYYIVFGC